MSEAANKNCIYFKIRVTKDYYHEKFTMNYGSSLEVATNVSITPKMNEFGEFVCILKNDRNKKLVCNFNFELNLFCEGSSVKVIKITRSGVELEEKKAIDLGFGKIDLKSYISDFATKLTLILQIGFTDNSS